MEKTLKRARYLSEEWAGTAFSVKIDQRVELLKQNIDEELESLNDFLDYAEEVLNECGQLSQ